MHSFGSLAACHREARGDGNGRFSFHLILQKLRSRVPDPDGVVFAGIGGLGRVRILCNLWRTAARDWDSLTMALVQERGRRILLCQAGNLLCFEKCDETISTSHAAGPARFLRDNFLCRSKLAFQIRSTSVTVRRCSPCDGFRLEPASSVHPETGEQASDSRAARAEPGQHPLVPVNLQARSAIQFARCRNSGPASRRAAVPHSHNASASNLVFGR